MDDLRTTDLPINLESFTEDAARIRIQESPLALLNNKSKLFGQSSNTLATYCNDELLSN